MSKTEGHKDGGITHLLAEGRRVQDGDGSYSVTIPKALANEWGLEGGDELLFMAEEGESKATIYESGSESGFSVGPTDD
ncbi:AbrB/MazE/SpoVT family DNA-binding domain-containing protein [Halorubrum sp. RMP-47]|uniref:AbrB/MazE/SpoVT family DNA-binding domain-containing protein n=1 Tax=Halorubrum miltondacostae TaxID=3076378 RepID=A0ABD5LYF1_9EURY